METRISSISQLDPIETLLSGDLFIVSRPNESSNTGYKTVKLSFQDFQDHLSAYIKQTFENTIKDVAGSVYMKQNIINTIRGSLEQTINTFIDRVEGNVMLVQDLQNYVSGDLTQTINTNINNVAGSVNNQIDVLNQVTADNATLVDTINANIQNVSGDVYSENGISSLLSALYAQVENNINSAIRDISGNVFNENALISQVKALSAYVHNNVESTIERVLGNVDGENNLISYVDATNATITNILNDIAAIKKSVSYPIVEVGTNDDGENLTAIVLLDKTVNVVTLDDGLQKSFWLQPRISDPERMLSRDIILHLKVNKLATDTTKNLIVWDPNIQFVAPDDESIFKEFSAGSEYIYYISEVGDNIFYISRQEIMSIDAPAASENEQPNLIIA